MNREQIIQHFTNNVKEYQRYARNIAGRDDADDLFQECTVMLLEFSEERLQGYWNKDEGLKPFFLRMLQLQYNSKTSKFDKEYRKQNRYLVDGALETIQQADMSFEDENEEDYNTAECVIARAHLRNSYAQTIELFDAVTPENIFDVVFDTYVEQGSLRKTLNALPEEYRNKLDLKKVQEIVNRMRKSLKKRIAKITTLDTSKLSAA